VRPAVVVALVGALGAVAGPAAAQRTDADLVRRIQRQTQQLDATYRLAIPKDQPISERLVLDVGGSVRFGIYGIDNNTSNTRILRQTDGIFFVRADLDGAHRFFGRARFLYDDFNSGDSFDGRGDDLAEPIVDRYWYQFDLRGQRLAQTGERIDANLGVKAGRQYVQWGAGLTLSNVMYAGLLDFELGDFVLTGLGGITPGSSTIDWDGTRPNFDRNTERAYFGGRLGFIGNPHFRPYGYALIQRDENDDDFFVFDSGFFLYPTKFNYDSEYYALGIDGEIGPQITYRAEVVHQRGEAYSSSLDSVTGLPTGQAKEDIEAWAALVGGTYLFRDPADSRFDVEFIAGSGDDDRLDSSDTFGGNRTGTTDRAFNGLGYVNTGLALAPEVSNLLSLRLTLSTAPKRPGGRSEWLRYGVSGFLFAKVDKDAPINVRTQANTFVGGEIDFYVDWRITSDISASLRYGVFLPGDAMPDGEDDARHFIYGGVTYAF
jgi:hypothetical protein